MIMAKKLYVEKKYILFFLKVTTKPLIKLVCNFKITLI